MAVTLPDLWSDDIQVSVVTPLVILRSQVAYLERKTQGILRADVATSSSDAWLLHQFDLIAPALRDYRRTLFTAKHNKDMIYPVYVQADCFAPANPFAMVSAVAIGGSPADQRTANTQDEFIDLVRSVFRSGQVRSIIQSLIARSNDATETRPDQGNGTVSSNDNEADQTGGGRE